MEGSTILLESAGEDDTSSLKTRGAPFSSSSSSSNGGRPVVAIPVIASSSGPHKQ